MQAKGGMLRPGFEDGKSSVQRQEKADLLPDKRWGLMTLSDQSLVSTKSPLSPVLEVKGGPVVREQISHITLNCHGPTSLESFESKTYNYCAV